MTTGRTGRTRLLAIGAALVALAVAGCADGGARDADDAGRGAATDAPASASPPAAPGAGGDERSADAADGDAADAAVAGEVAGAEAGPGSAVELVAAARSVVRTGSMRVTVDDPDGAAEEVRRLATGAGGFVGDEQHRAADDTVELTVRVPADGFDDLRSDVGELGEVTEQDVRSDDVTADVVDLDSRIGSLRASVDRLRSLLSEAGDVGQLATVEAELTTRESELEALLGQQRVLEDQVALATLSVHLGVDDPAPAPAEDAAGFTDGLRRGWVAMVDGARAASAVVGFLAPFAVAAVPAALAVRWWRRRRQAPPATT